MEDLVSQVNLKGCPASLLSEWAGHARQCKRLHEAAASHFSGRSDTGLITAVVLGSAGGVINILLGAVSAEYGGVINGSQVALGCVSVTSAAIMRLVNNSGGVPGLRLMPSMRGTIAR